MILVPDRQRNNTGLFLQIKEQESKWENIHYLQSYLPHVCQERGYNLVLSKQIIIIEDSL